MIAENVKLIKRGVLERSCATSTTFDGLALTQLRCACSNTVELKINKDRFKKILERQTASLNIHLNLILIQPHPFFILYTSPSFIHLRQFHLVGV